MSVLTFSRRATMSDQTSADIELDAVYGDLYTAKIYTVYG